MENTINETKGATVERVRFPHGCGAGTRVILADGRRITFMGRIGKRAAIAAAAGAPAMAFDTASAGVAVR